MRYYVGVKEVYEIGFYVEADNPERAKAEAARILETGDEEGVPDYSHTLDRDQWYVERKD